jgi:hypothetical protein
MRRFILAAALAIATAFGYVGVTSPANAGAATAVVTGGQIRVASTVEQVHYRHRRHYRSYYGYSVPRVYGYYGRPKHYHKRRYYHRPYYRKHYKHRHYRRW